MPKAKQPSRKSKSAWRKNIDIDAVEKSLERQRVAERTGEEHVHAGTNASSIFVEDRQGEGTSLLSGRQQQQQGKKGLKSLQILYNASGARGLTSRARKGGAGGAKDGSKQQHIGGVVAADGSGGLTPEQRAIRAGMSKKDIERLRRVAGRDVKGAFGVIVEEEEGAGTKRGLEALIEPGTYDVWATTKGAASREKAQGTKGKGKRKIDVDDEDTNEDQEEGEIQLPRSYLHATKKGKSKALAMPKPGQSYNPSAEDHEELLKRAIDVARKEEERKQQEMEWKKAWDAGAKEARGKGNDDIEDLVGLKVGQGDLAALGSDDEEDGDDEDKNSLLSDDDDEEADTKQSKEVKRKTKQQRAKAKKLKEEQRARMALKAARRSQSDLQSLRSLKKQLTTIEREKAEAAEIKRLAKQQGLDRRVGVYKMPREDDDVQLGEDLAEGLRLLKPEGNLLKDRVHTFYKRGIIEPKKRDVIGKNKRGSMRGRKEYESHAYKRFS